MVVFVIFFLMLLAILFLTNQALQLQEKEFENELVKEYVESVGELCSGFQERKEYIRRYRHDLSKHIRILQSMAEEEGVPEGQDGSETGNFRKWKAFIGEENAGEPCSLLETLLCIHKERCEEAQIPFSVIADPRDCLRIDTLIRDIDLVALLQNLFDNAIEAQERIPAGEPKGIQFSMTRESGMLRIELQNQISFTESVDFRTTKPEPSEHGLGMKIIDVVARHYNGQWERTADSKKHVLKIVLMFPLMEQDEAVNKKKGGAG